MTKQPDKTPMELLNPPPTRHIVFVVYEGVSLLDLSGPLEAFRIASEFSGNDTLLPLYKCSVVSISGGAVMTADGIEIVTEPAVKVQGVPTDTLIAPGAFSVETVIRDRQLIDWVRDYSTNCRRVCSVCAGTFLLAAAGLLHAKRATTHWMHCALLAQKHPSITVEQDTIFVKDGIIWTSAGVTTGIDLALALIEEDAGWQTAMTVARVLVVYLRRAGGQSQYSAILAAQASSLHDRFWELEQWIAENLTTRITVETLAEKMNMSPRNFARVYKIKRGRTPTRAVEAIRIDAGRRLLEETDTKIHVIARHCGFKNEEQMRHAFIKILGISPRDYRERFGVFRNTQTLRNTPTFGLP